MKSEYLDRPLIDGVVYEITETRISIQSPNTCIVCCVLPERCEKKDMLKLYKRVLQMAKAKKVKISYSLHIHKTIREQWDDYVSKREKQEQIFLQLRESAAVVQQHGIHVGYCDDTELAKAINYSLKLSELFHADDIARQIAGFEGHLLKTERFLIDQGGEGDMIVL